MSLPISELEKLDSYSFSLYSYAISHSTLTLYAAGPDTQPIRLLLHFADVSYLQMPIDWRSPFELGSNGERENVIKKAGLPLGGVSSGVKLFKSKDGKVIILGALMAIEEVKAR